MWRRLIVASAVGIAAVAVPTPALAAEPPLVPAKIALQPSCAQIVQKAQQTAVATGKSSTVPCLSRIPQTTVQPMEVAGCGSSWKFGRHSACKIEDGYVLNVFTIGENGVPRVVGQMFHSVTSATQTSGASGRWLHDFTVTMGYAWGVVSGTELFAFPDCRAANCSVLGGNFEYGPVRGGEVHSGRAALGTVSPGFGSVWLTASSWGWQFANPAWVNPVSETITIDSPAHRCDEALGIAGSVGCVYIQKRPEHEIYMSRFPKYARHIQLAINFGLPSVLTRILNSELRDANRAVACPPGQRPANNWSCDEYPFASTLEGAANPMHPYGRTFMILNWNNGNPPFYCGINWVSTRQLGDSRGYSVCGIPVEENSGGGSDLQVFYQANRVISSDQFSVKVI